MTKGHAGWRQPILQHFSKGSAEADRLTVVSDPDALLTEPGTVEAITTQGFELVTADDPMALRFVYESRFRQHWDRGAIAHIVVVSRANQSELHRIPYDLLDEARSCGRLLAFSLADVFPSLSPNVVADLDRQYFDSLASVTGRNTGEILGINATRDFILRQVFDISPEQIMKPADLLRVLLRIHYRSLNLPDSLSSRLIEILGQGPQWLAWPLERIVPNRDSFLAFLNERWPYFLLSKGLEAITGREPPSPAISGPLEIPFDHEDVRVYIDNFFAEGLLEPTAAVRSTSKDEWFAVGVVGSTASTPVNRFHQLLADLNSQLPEMAEAPHQAWQDFSLRWGTWVRLRWHTLNDRDAQSESDAAELIEIAQSTFASWLKRRLGALASLPYLPRPVLGHHVPHYLAQQLTDGDAERVALVVVDGMAVDQWRILRKTLEGFKIDEHAIFSWVPTLTPIGRQALFSGRPPLEYAASIESTYREPHHWSSFWQDHGLSERKIKFVGPQGNLEPTKAAFQRLLDAAEAQVMALGGVINFIDQSLHHVRRGTPALHALVEEWGGSGEFSYAINGLLQRGFTVYLTSDHGNVSGRGFGKPNVGVTAQQRGQRAHIFRNKPLRDKIAAQFPEAIEWPQIGLPKDYFPLLAPHGAAFLPPGREAVSHGGITIDEVMVPFVRVSES